MTWPRAVLYLGIWAMLSVYYAAFERAPQTPAPPAEAAAGGQRFVPLRVDEIVTFALDADGIRLRCERRDGQWQVREPIGAPVPSDLIAAMIATLTELPPVQIVPLAGAGEVGEFGLDTHAVRVTLGDREDQVRVQLGARNPSQTAVYARRDGAEDVVLVGLNVQYYVDLLIEALRRHGP